MGYREAATCALALLAKHVAAYEEGEPLSKDGGEGELSPKQLLSTQLFNGMLSAVKLCHSEDSKHAKEAATAGLMYATCTPVAKVCD